MTENPRESAVAQAPARTVSAGPLAISDETLRTLFADITGKQSSLFRFFGKSVVVDLASWEEFSSFDTSQAEHITEISMKFDYLTRHTRSADAERYIVEVSVRSQR